MKKLLLLSAFLIFACSSDDSSDTNDNNNNNELLNCDGNPVPTIVYGTQEWTVENACHITYRDGTPIPQVTDNDEWANLTTGAWCYYDNDPNKGVLYNWYAVAGIHDNDENTPNKEFAPEGWHVPTKVEWETLENYLIASGNNYDGTTTDNKIGKAMASTTGWNGSTTTGAVGNDQSLNNSSGFNAFPVGERGNNFTFIGEGLGAKFWTSTHFYGEYNEDYAYFHLLYFDIYYCHQTIQDERNGSSVRFVRD